jgi:hypothetical protein
MRVKKNLPKEGLRLVDDISKQNMALITRLRSSQHFENVWYMQRRFLASGINLT